MRIVVLLRGVNVGGVRFGMGELAQALTGAGFGEVRTVLASGNIVLGTDLPLSDAAEGVSSVILQRFGFTVLSFACDARTVRDAVAGYPFGRAADRHAYVVFGRPAALGELMESSAQVDGDDERVASGDGVVYWDVPKGRTLDSPFGRLYGRRLKAGAITTRNINTLEKIVSML